MKKLLLAVFASVLILGSAVVAAAMPPVRANIPFAFHVGDAVLPAGEYVIRTTGHSVGTTYMIESRNGFETYFVATVPGEKQYNESGYQLTFTKYGNACFLSKIRAGSTEVTMAKGHTETELSQLKGDKVPVVASLMK